MREEHCKNTIGTDTNMLSNTKEEEEIVTA